MHRHKKIVKLYYKKVYRHPDWYAFISIKQIQLHNTTMIYVKKGKAHSLYSKAVVFTIHDPEAYHPFMPPDHELHQFHKEMCCNRTAISIVGTSEMISKLNDLILC